MGQNQTLQSVKRVFISALDQNLTKAKVSKGPRGRILVLAKGEKVSAKERAALSKWQRDELNEESALLKFETKSGLFWLVRPHLASTKLDQQGHLNFLEVSDYSFGRDQVGAAVVSAIDAGVSILEIEFQKVSEELLLGGLVAIDLANYQYKNIFQKTGQPRLGIKIVGVEKKVLTMAINRAKSISQSVNLARHLVNLPPNELYPESYVQIVEWLKKSWKKSKVEVWRTERLKKERMGLLLAVGQGSINEPRLVKISYRGAKKSKTKTLAIVGKGITFDTGGVNLKTASGMRLMKKDMGGSAAVLGLANFLNVTGFDGNVDLYLALAENSVGSNSFRPSDIITSRSGETVEIHNTDAEGRLVLADAMALAVEDNPAALLDVATLTGAIKVGLGASIAGLFGNDDGLIKQMMAAAVASGDPVWPMPLHRKYKTALRTTPADVVNANDGFGGAITAALFLDVFAKNVPWLHLDIYAWKDSAEGAMGEAGGSGQAVQALTRFVSSYFQE